MIDYLPTRTSPKIVGSVEPIREHQVSSGKEIEGLCEGLWRGLSLESYRQRMLEKMTQSYSRAFAGELMA